MITLGIPKIDTRTMTSDGRRWVKRRNPSVQIWRTTLGTGQKQTVNLCLPFAGGVIHTVSFGGVDLWMDDVELQESNVLTLRLPRFLTSVLLTVFASHPQCLTCGDRGYAGVLCPIACPDCSTEQPECKR
jgi:hypothetical protein